MYRPDLILDIFSRKVIHFEVHPTETGELAKAFIDAAIAANDGIRPDAIFNRRPRHLHDLPTGSGPPRRFGYRPIHSRPHVSNDNPYSEANLRTLNTAPHSPAIRIHPRCPRLLRHLLRLLQQRTPPFRPRPLTPATVTTAPLTKSKPTAPSPQRRLHSQPRALPPPPHTATPTHQGLDQPTTAPSKPSRHHTTTKPPDVASSLTGSGLAARAGSTGRAAVVNARRRQKPMSLGLGWSSSLFAVPAERATGGVLTGGVKVRRT